MVRSVGQVLERPLTRVRGILLLGGSLALLLWGIAYGLSELLDREQTRRESAETIAANLEEHLRDEWSDLAATTDSIASELENLKPSNRTMLFELIERRQLGAAEAVEIGTQRGEVVAWWGEQPPARRCDPICFDTEALYLVRGPMEIPGEEGLEIRGSRRIDLRDLSRRFSEEPLVRGVSLHERPDRSARADDLRIEIEPIAGGPVLLSDVSLEQRESVATGVRSAGGAASLTLLAISLLIAGWTAIREQPEGATQAAIFAGFAALSRTVLLLSPHHDPPEVFGFETFASRVLGGLSRSPADLLLTGLYLSLITAVVWRAAGPAVRRLCSYIALAIGPPAAVVLVGSVVLNSRVPPVPTRLVPESLVQAMLALALLSLALSLLRFPDASQRDDRNRMFLISAAATVAGLGLALLIARESLEIWLVVHGLWLGGMIAGSRTRTAAGSAFMRALTAVLIIYSTAAIFQRESATQFVSEIRAPLVRGAGQQQLAMVEEVVTREISDLDLSQILPAHHTVVDLSTLAWTLWKRTDLSRLSIPALLIIRDPVGNEISRFGEGSLHEGWEATISWDVPLRDRSEVAAEATIYVADPADPKVSARYDETLQVGGSRTEAAGIELMAPAVFDDAGNAAVEPEFRFERSPFWYIQSSKPGEQWWVEPASPENALVFLDRTEEGLFAFPLMLPTIGEHLRRLGSLLILALLLVIVMAAPRFFDRFAGVGERLLRPGFRAKLAATMIFLAVLPFGIFVLFLRIYLADRLEDEYLERGREALDSAQRVMIDYLDSREDARPEDVFDDEIFAWLSRVVGHDLHLYRDHELVASSRRELLASGFDSERLPGNVYRNTVLGGSQIYLDERELEGVTFVEIYSPILLNKGEAWTLALPMLVQAPEISAEVEALATTLWLLMILILTTALVAAARAARTVSGPVDQLASAAREVGRGNLDPALPAQTDDEIGLLVDTFRDMAGSIRRQQADLTFERDRLQILLENIDVAVLLLDSSGRITASNAAARALFGDDPSIEQLQRSEFGGILTGAISSGSQVEIESDEGRRTWQIASVPLAGVNARILLMEDVTEIVRSHRIEAWAEMARQIAHDIKNPLTPIQLTAEHLATLADRGDPRLRDAVARGVEKILQQVEALRSTSRDFNEFATTRPLEKREVLADRLIRTTLEPYEIDGAEARLTYRSSLDGETILADERVIRGALTNLIENALQVDEERVEVIASAERDVVRIDVIDRGPGVQPADLSRIFEPYFSTRSAGTGLGLAIARKAAVDHGGSIEAENLASGFRVRLEIPVARTESA